MKTNRYIVYAINTSPGRLICLLNNTSQIMEMLFHLPVLLHLLIAFNHPFIIPLFLFMFHSHAHFFFLFLAQTQCTDEGEVKLFLCVDVSVDVSALVPINSWYYRMSVKFNVTYTQP